MKTNYSILMRRISAILAALVLCWLSFSPQSAEAQPGVYRLFSYGAGNPNTASAWGNNASIGGMQAGNYLGSGQNWRSASSFYGRVLASVPINFTYKFLDASGNLSGTAYTQAYIYSNGLVTLGNTSTNPTNNDVSQNSSIPHFGIFWQNYGSTGGGAPWYGCTSEQLRYETVGSSPNRVFVISYYQWALRVHNDYNTGYYSTGENRGSMQFRLYEKGQVEYYYDFMDPIVECANWRGGGWANQSFAAIGFGLGSSSQITVNPNGGGFPGSTAPTWSTSSLMNRSIDISNSSNTIPSGTLYVFDAPPPPNRQLSTFPKIVNYGIQVVGSNTVMTVTAKNTNDALGPLTITGATLTGATTDYKITTNPTPATLNAGQSIQFQITFTPTQAGSRNALLLISSNGLDSGTQAIILTGAGIVSDYTYDSSFLFRNTRTRLGDTLIQCIHFVSTGGANLIFSSATFAGIDANQYKVVHMPPPMPKGTLDSICVAYIPTLEGRRGATLNITSNARTYPTLSIPLYGYGILPHIVVTPSSLLLFDSTYEGDTTCKNLTIWNPGSDTLRLSANFLSSGDGDFIYPQLTGGLQNIAPDQTRTIQVCFAPRQQGTREATLTLRTNIINTFETPRRDTAGTLMIQFRGTGLPLGIFKQALSGLPILDSAIVGQNVCRTETLSNVGDADIKVTAFTIAAPWSETGLPAMPFILKARSSITFNVCATPTVAGLTSGVITVTGTTSERTITSNLPVAVFGVNVCVAAPATLFDQVVLPNNGTADSMICFSITNCGDLADTYTFKLSGANAADYTIISETPGGTIAPTAADTVCLRYKPSALGASPATLEVTPAKAAATSILLGGSTGCAQLAVTTPVVPQTGQWDDQTFDITITNTGTFTWNPGSIVIIGGTEFTLDATNPFTINGDAPNQTITLHLHFKPTTIGTFTAQVTFPGSGPCDSLAAISLSGTSVKGSVAPATSEGFSLDQTYPNPTQGKATFNYTTPRECTVRISLVDMTGRVLENLVNGNVSGGEYTVSFDASKYPSGTYIYMLESGSVKLTRQLTLTK